MQKINLVLEADKQMINTASREFEALQVNLVIPDQILVDDKVYLLLTPDPVSAERTAELVELLARIGDLVETPPLVMTLKSFVADGTNNYVCLYYPRQTTASPSSASTPPSS